MNSDIAILDGGIATDDRGCVRFVNDFNFKGVKRFYQVENHRQGFIRAWHGHKKEGKYVYTVLNTPFNYIKHQSFLNHYKSF